MKDLLALGRPLATTIIVDNRWAGIPHPPASASWNTAPGPREEAQHGGVVHRAVHKCSEHDQMDLSLHVHTVKMWTEQRFAQSKDVHSIPRAAGVTFGDSQMIGRGGRAARTPTCSSPRTQCPSGPSSTRRTTRSSWTFCPFFWTWPPSMCAPSNSPCAAPTTACRPVKPRATLPRRFRTAKRSCFGSEGLRGGRALFLSVHCCPLQRHPSSSLSVQEWWRGAGGRCEGPPGPRAAALHARNRGPYQGRHR